MFKANTGEGITCQKREKYRWKKLYMRALEEHFILLFLMHKRIARVRKILRSNY